VFVVVVDHLLDVVVVVMVVIVDADALPVADSGNAAGNRWESPMLAPSSPSEPSRAVVGERRLAVVVVVAVVVRSEPR